MSLKINSSVSRQSWYRHQIWCFGPWTLKTQKKGYQRSAKWPKPCVICKSVSSYNTIHRQAATADTALCKAAVIKNSDTMTNNASNLGSPWCLIYFSHVHILAIRWLIWLRTADCKAIYCHYVAKMLILAHTQHNTLNSKFLYNDNGAKKSLWAHVPTPLDQSGQI